VAIIDHTAVPGIETQSAIDGHDPPGLHDARMWPQRHGATRRGHPRLGSSAIPADEPSSSARHHDASTHLAERSRRTSASTSHPGGRDVRGKTDVSPLSRRNSGGSTPRVHGMDGFLCDFRIVVLETVSPSDPQAHGVRSCRLPVAGEDGAQQCICS
jgi:hypothetical protein